MLHHKQFRGEIEAIECVANPYDTCVANKNVNNEQHTLTWHADDMKSSHVDPKANDKFHEWAEKKHRSE